MGEQDGVKTYLANDVRTKHSNSFLFVVKQIAINDSHQQTPQIKLDNIEREVRKFQQLYTLKGIDLIREQSEDGEELYLVRSYSEGVSLKKKLNQQKSFSLEEAISLLENALYSLNLLHQQGLIHRNIKPSNLIISEANGKIESIDWGILQTIREDNRGTKLVREGHAYPGFSGYKPAEQIVGLSLIHI